jgi:hypothetical protein
MTIAPRIRDRDPALTCRRILLTVRAVGDTVPFKVVEWIRLTIDDQGDGDLRKIVAFAVAASAGKLLANEALTIIRDVCARRVASVA